MRRAQGFIREARSMKAKLPNEIFRLAVVRSIDDMKRYNNLRVEKFKNYLRAEYELFIENPVQDQIKRNQQNPMLRKNNYAH